MHFTDVIQNSPFFHSLLQFASAFPIRTRRRRITRTHAQGEKKQLVFVRQKNSTVQYDASIDRSMSERKLKLHRSELQYIQMELAQLQLSRGLSCTPRSRRRWSRPPVRHGPRERRYSLAPTRTRRTNNAISTELYCICCTNDNEGLGYRE
uniref:Uncharacterized protein n=1 Tax=Oryza brachyantha TaxID=4533 RepID=J3L0M2_ORYBR